MSADTVAMSTTHTQSAGGASAFLASQNRTSTGSYLGVEPRLETASTQSARPCAPTWLAPTEDGFEIGFLA
jgi:hypothetical protein